MKRILVVDDDPHIREVISFALQHAGMEVIAAGDGAEALVSAERDKPDLVILDIGLPEFDGLEVCRRIRKRDDTPILFLSARGDEIDRVLGLELGGDDYVVKPFSPRELVARISSILKRTATASRSPAVGDGLLQRGALKIDAPRFQVSFAERPVALTAIEFAIVNLLAARPGVVFTRETIMEQTYANVHVSDRTIDSHVRNIRGKFASVGCDSVVETVHGVGFRLGPVEAPA